MSDSQYIIIEYLGSFDPAKGPIGLHVINNGLMEVRQGGVTQFTAANHASDKSVVAEVEKFNAVCAKLAAEKAAKEKDEELTKLEEKREHFSKFIATTIGFLCNLGVDLENEAFLRHLYRKEKACALKITIMKLQCDLKKNPVHRVDTRTLRAQRIHLRLLLEKGDECEDVMKESFLKKCLNLINTATRLEVAVSLLNDY